MPTPPPSLEVPDDFIAALAERLADRVGELISDRSDADAQWMRTREAAEYLGLTRNSLYGRVHDIPHYKIDRMLLFKKQDLDEWLERHRVEPKVVHPAQAPQSGTRRRVSPRRDRLDLLPIGPTRPETKKPRSKRERPLPPPRGGTEAHKEHWAQQLEISRSKLDEMSPVDFKEAWDQRNERLRKAGVFDHINELAERFGWNELHKQLPSTLITAVGEIQRDASPGEGVVNKGN